MSLDSFRDMRAALEKSDVNTAAHPYFDWHRNAMFLSKDREHYRLLAYLALCTLRSDPSSVVLDIGTYIGMSAAVMGLARSAFTSSSTNDVDGIGAVISYDIVDHFRFPRLTGSPCAKDIPASLAKIEFVIGNVLERLDDHVLKGHARLIVLDTDHDGVFEGAIYGALTTLGYRGLLVLDDIHLNQRMKDFWGSIKHKKVDATSVGHWSGTGVVVFDPSYVDFPC